MPHRTRRNGRILESLRFAPRSRSGDLPGRAPPPGALSIHDTRLAAFSRLAATGGGSDQRDGAVRGNCATAARPGMRAEAAISTPDGSPGPRRLPHAPGPAPAAAARPRDRRARERLPSAPAFAVVPPPRQARHFARGVQAGNRVEVAIKHPAPEIGLDAPEVLPGQRKELDR